jgi:predicted acylesterase/phospholipase RssA
VKGGLISHEGIAELISVHAPKTFEDLKIPLAVTTVDIQSGELIVSLINPLDCELSGRKIASSVVFCKG